MRCDYDWPSPLDLLDLDLISAQQYVTMPIEFQRVISDHEKHGQSIRRAGL
ncbi:MAG: hypothetical protein V3T86_09600 [Planctomycetota bacterium]